MIEYSLASMRVLYINPSLQVTSPVLLITVNSLRGATTTLLWLQMNMERESGMKSHLRVSEPQLTSNSVCFSCSPFPLTLLICLCLILCSCTGTVRVFCQGSLNLGSDTYSVTCSSGSDAHFNPLLWLNYTLCVLDGQVVPCKYMHSFS